MPCNLMNSEGHPIDFECRSRRRRPLNRAFVLVSIMVATAACGAETQPPPTQAERAATAAPAPEPKQVVRDACLESGQPAAFCACLREVQPRITAQVQEKGAADPETLEAASTCTALMEVPGMASEEEAK